MLIPCLGLAFLVFVTLRSFYEDRLAYIFDASLTQTRLQSEMTHSLIQKVSLQINKTMENHSSLETEEIKTLEGKFVKIMGDSPLRAIDLFYVGKESKNVRRILSARGTISADTAPQETQEQIKAVASRALNELETAKGPVFQSNGNPESVSMWFQTLFIIDNPDIAVLGRANIDISELSRMYPGQLVTQSFWFDHLGKPLFASFQMNLETTTQIGKNAIANAGRSGSFLFSQNGQDPHIVSYSRVGDLNIFTSNLTLKRLALEPVKLIESRIILLFVIIQCVTIAIGITLSRRLTKALRQLLFAADSFSKGDFAVSIRIQTRDEIYQLGEKFLEMVQKMKKLLSDTRDLGRMEAELKTAQTVQQTIFPNPEWSSDTIALYSFSEPCSECGGDFWFHEKIEDYLFVGLGDATGHGASAALITSACRAAISVVLRNRILEPHRILHFLNLAINDTAKAQITMTLFLLRVHLPSGEMVYANAGHEPGLLINGEAKSITKKNIVILSDGPTHALGRDVKAVYEQETLSLVKGDILTLYTDGVYDLTNPENETWGERRFTQAFLEGVKSSTAVKVCVNKIVDIMSEFRKKSPLIDDVTLVMIKKKI